VREGESEPKDTWVFRLQLLKVNKQALVEKIYTVHLGDWGRGPRSVSE
jgi:hypothetical protein